MENLTKEEIRNKLVIWERLSNDSQIMEVAAGLVNETLENLYKAYKIKKAV